MRVALIDDQNIFRECLCECMAECPDLELFGSYPDTQGFLASLRTGHLPDVVLLDIALADGLALGFPQRLRKLYPTLRVVWITAAQEELILDRAFAENLPGFVHKTDTLEEVIEALRDVAAGRRHYSRRVLSIWENARASHRHISKLLSTRQQQVLGYIISGFRVTEIAALLGLSPETVKAHRRDIMARLGVHSSRELQAYAIQTGFSQIPPARP